VGKGKRREAREVEYVDAALGGWLGQASQAAGFAPSSELESRV
jgi:hypothetical protein